MDEIYQQELASIETDKIFCGGRNRTSTATRLFQTVFGSYFVWICGNNWWISLLVVEGFLADFKFECLFV